jgi:L-aspartate oxidase
LAAGAGLCDEPAVRALVTEGPPAVRNLIAFGAAFDTEPDGAIALTREGGHHRDRVLHAGGDATGAEVSRALVAAVHAAPDIEVIQHAIVLDLLKDETGRAAGVTLHVLGEGQRDGVGAALARAVVLATGGMGHVFASTTNPPVSTGDGVALALRAGAEVSDLEFVQFHPTSLWLGRAATGQQPLVSEAMRGEGAVLVDASGRRIMSPAIHPLADLAPRDVVTKAVTRAMAEAGTDHVYLDATKLGAELLLHRFPTIVARCREAGVDPVRQPIPVTPAAHYASGGVRTDLLGRTSVQGLYACGEVACSGVHGANRLASNSLLEGLVFASRIGGDLGRGLPPQREPVPSFAEASVIPPSRRSDITSAMTDGAGVLRSAESLAATAKILSDVGEQRGMTAETDAWETTNLHAVSSVLTAAAARRQETRGCHWREDFTESDESWRVHIVSRIDDDGQLVVTYEPVR